MDTIIALTTPPGRSGVAVLRVSGDQAIDFLGRLIAEKNPLLLPTRNLLLRSLYDQDGDVLDKALVSVMPGPNSFTGEDVAEIMCHGNPIIVDAVINTMILFGARPARPGEFSRRAVEHGKVSLLQAEALNGLIHAVSLPGVALAQKGLSGSVDQNEQELREELLDICAELEARMDYPQEDLSYESDADLAEKLLSLAQCAKFASSSWRGNRIQLEGAKVAIVGPVNAGKSSLFNHLVGSHRAIVSDQPGTTRDVVERRVVHQGLDICYFDTAGFREQSDDSIELEGMAMGLSLAASADLVLMVFPVWSSQKELDLLSSKISSPKLLIATQCDIGSAQFSCDLECSSTTETGIDEVKNAITTKLTDAVTQAQRWTALSQRQQELFWSVAEHLERAKSSLLGLAGPVVAAEELTQALERLSELRGDDARESVLDRLFSRFCIGK